jgi:hypothetical protein
LLIPQNSEAQSSIMYDAVQFLIPDAYSPKLENATLKFKFVKSHVCKEGTKRSYDTEAKALTINSPYADGKHHGRWKKR